MCLRADRSTAQRTSYALLVTRIGHERADYRSDEYFTLYADQLQHPTEDVPIYRRVERDPAHASARSMEPGYDLCGANLPDPPRVPETRVPEEIQRFIFATEDG